MFNSYCFSFKWFQKDQIHSAHGILVILLRMMPYSASKWNLCASCLFSFSSSRCRKKNQTKLHFLLLSYLNSKFLSQKMFSGCGKTILFDISNVFFKIIKNFLQCSLKMSKKLILSFINRWLYLFLDIKHQNQASNKHASSN